MHRLIRLVPSIILINLPYLVLMFTFNGHTRYDLQCPRGEFLCAINDKKVCLPSNLKCDGNPDCDDGFDEIACYSGPESRLCRIWEFSCIVRDHFTCVPENWKCDGKEDCLNGEDEEGCTKCNAYSFVCNSTTPNASYMCLSYKWICDGDNDCGDAEDEHGCECDPPDNPNNGSVSVTGNHYQDKAEYSCLGGYILKGNRFRTCELGAIWSGTDPHCEFIDCGDPEYVVNGNVTTINGTIYQSIALYSCDEGFTLKGESKRVCENNGKWESSSPTCEHDNTIVSRSRQKKVTIILTTLVCVMTLIIVIVLYSILRRSRNSNILICWFDKVKKKSSQPAGNDIGSLATQSSERIPNRDYDEEEYSVERHLVTAENNDNQILTVEQDEHETLVHERTIIETTVTSHDCPHSESQETTQSGRPFISYSESDMTSATQDSASISDFKSTSRIRNIVLNCNKDDAFDDEKSTSNRVSREFSISYEMLDIPNVALIEAISCGVVILGPVRISDNESRTNGRDETSYVEVDNAVAFQNNEEHTSTS